MLGHMPREKLMPHIKYVQSTGDMVYYGGPDSLPITLGVGWSGNGEGKNNPTMQAVRCVGPIPVGMWSIGEPFTHPKVGPFAMRLLPLDGTETRGRDGFLIHGPSKNQEHRGQESEGCIILTRDVRERIHSLAPEVLEVVAYA